jgi:NAD(P)-dependent dehydrogenase (short-subunit alcohol dehydrogenase family)
VRAIIFDASAPQNSAFGDVPEPRPTAPDELLTEVKAVSLNFGEGLANKVGPQGVRVNVVAPGLIVTAPVNVGSPNAPKPYRRSEESRLVDRPVGRRWAEASSALSDLSAVLADSNWVLRSCNSRM